MGFLKRFFGIKQFNEVILSEKVIENIINLAKDAYPKEFIAVLKGKVTKKKLKITSLIFQRYQASYRAAAIKFELPILSGSFGTIHSHPSYSNRPSNQDLNLFTRDKVGRLRKLKS